MISNKHEFIERQKSGKYQDSFASSYKVTQNPNRFNGQHIEAGKDIPLINDHLSRDSMHKRAKSMLNVDGEVAEMHAEGAARLPTLKKP